METELTSPETIDTVLRYASWSVIGFAALWLVTSVIGYFHRRAYNLTHAESGTSKPVTPDFLKVDKSKRDAAVGRGQAYEQVLKEREAPPQTPVTTMRSWSRILATFAALVTLITASITAIEKIEAYQRKLEEITVWDRIVELVTQNPVGVTLAIAVIGANIYIFVRKFQKPD